MTKYPAVPVSPDFAKLEDAILKRWQDEKIFEASVERNPRRNADGSSNEFVFYDGPPFANGLPHYGHIVTGFVKDIVPRYQTMKGRHVERRFGWDCHGLPAELVVEKELGVNGAREIIDYGIGKFNKACETSVTRFTQDWEWYVTRQGRWVDFEDQYRTMDITFMESVMWAFKTLWDKGLIYEGYRIVPYSWAVQTPLSNFETRLDNSYRERTDPTLTVGFMLNDNDKTGANTRLLAWTTTPWTLPSNMALCVNPELTYVLLQKDDQRVIIAEAARERYARELKDFEPQKEFKGSDLVGLTYTPLFPYFKGLEGAFRVFADSFVEADSGTGTVHIAPGFGEEDMELGKRNNIPIVVPVDEAGLFTPEITDYAGQNVILEANEKIIQDLKKQGVVLKHDQILHSYPHCWRTDQPLIYKAVNSWYLAVTQFRDRMVELNQDITWVPGHIKDGAFGNWLANARDWNISRNRFWGAPIPVWRSDDDRYPRIDVYGSIEELERDFGVKVDNLHRPMIDDLVRPNPDDPTGQSMMRRVPEVLDCWFESGSMPFAQLHYPFENKDRFEDNFPGDFIVEYIAQTRGWFYTLMVLSTALFDRAPFKSCICHGVVLDENHQKLSKRLKNYPDPVDVFNNLGSDALRWYLCSSPLITGGDLAMSRDDSEIVKGMRSVIIRLWNAFYFFTLYANVENVEAKISTKSDSPMNRFLLGKTAKLIEQIEGHLDNMDLPSAYNCVPDYIEALNNWYIRNSRSLFWDEAKSAEKQDAYDTLYTSLVYASKALGPLLPFISEEIYTALTGETSVHLTDWPNKADLPVDEDVLKGMDMAREACSAVLRLRELHRRRVRLPLKTLVIAHPEIDKLAPYIELIRDAVNIVDVQLSSSPSEYGERAVKVNPKLGKQFGAKFKDIMTAQRNNDFTLLDDGRLEIAGETLSGDDFEMRFVVPEGTTAESFDRWRGLTVLDTTIYPELEVEGWSRDLISGIQKIRKDMQLEITERITITASVPETVREALQPFVAHVSKETLANDLCFLQDNNVGDDFSTVEVGEHEVSVKVSKA
ncbi:MAG: isoleucine--tRNA ligase [Pseudobdellovibrionaceae bacterium]|jgi:isoleucyl-tRNA synthetase|nr:isoleucine--tRNA ligase [Pseudobdellovibrionaceae bacterium]